jgi:hypothetical protein
MSIDSEDDSRRASPRPHPHRSARPADPASFPSGHAADFESSSTSTLTAQPFQHGAADCASAQLAARGFIVVREADRASAELARHGFIVVRQAAPLPADQHPSAPAHTPMGYMALSTLYPQQSIHPAPPPRQEPILPDPVQEVEALTRFLETMFREGKETYEDCQDRIRALNQWAEYKCADNVALTRQQLNVLETVVENLRIEYRSANGQWVIDPLNDYTFGA